MGLEGSQRLGPERCAHAYAWRSLLDRGVAIAGGSDFPVESLNPLLGIGAAVTRQRPGAENGAWHPEQRLTLEQALIAMCVNPAWLAGDEWRRGKLIPGFLADLVVLDRDPFTVEQEELSSIQVVATMVGGRWVHNPPPWD